MQLVMEGPQNLNSLKIKVKLVYSELLEVACSFFEKKIVRSSIETFSMLIHKEIVYILDSKKFQFFIKHFSEYFNYSFKQAANYFNIIYEKKIH